MDTPTQEGVEVKRKPGRPPMVKISEVEGQEVKNEIPIIGKREGIRVIGEKYYELTIHEQDETVRRKDIFITDGSSRTFQVLLDKKVILPQGCLNVLKESIYTKLRQKEDLTAGRVQVDKEDIPRFSIQIHREVGQEEAEKWLANELKQYYRA